MKKLVLVFVAIAIAAGAYAQIDTTNSKMSMRETNSNHTQKMQNNPVDKLLPDGVLMQNGIVMKVKDGQMTILEDSMTMSNGTKIMSDGTYTKKDGTKKMMEEGQHMDMSGTMISMKTNKDKNMDKNMDMKMDMKMDMEHNNNTDLNRSGQNNSADKSLSDGVMMQHGKIMMVKDGQMSVLDHDMTMSNGTKVMSDGFYTKKDAAKMMLKEGQHIDMSGNMSYVKTNKDKNMHPDSDSTVKKDCK